MRQAAASLNCQPTLWPESERSLEGWEALHRCIRNRGLAWAQHQSRSRWCRIAKAALPSSTHVFYLWVQSGSRSAEAKEYMPTPWEDTSRIYHPSCPSSWNSVSHARRAPEERGKLLACSAGGLVLPQDLHERKHNRRTHIPTQMSGPTLEGSLGRNDGSKQEQPSSRQRRLMEGLGRAAGTVMLRQGPPTGVPRCQRCWVPFLFFS